jgi:hypothetical protein
VKRAVKILIGAAAAIVVVAVAGIALLWYFITRGPDLAQFEHLKQPQISTMPNQKMVVLEAKGDPTLSARKHLVCYSASIIKSKTLPKA